MDSVPVLHGIVLRLTGRFNKKATRALLLLVTPGNVHLRTLKQWKRMKKTAEHWDFGTKPVQED